MHALGKKLGRIIPVLFPHLTGRRAGTRINDFRKGVGDGLPQGRVPGHAAPHFRRRPSGT